jgi:hypothetical protein
LFYKWGWVWLVSLSWAQQTVLYPKSRLSLLPVSYFSHTFFSVSLRFTKLNILGWLQ